jgi:hypothetical protein
VGSQTPLQHCAPLAQGAPAGSQTGWHAPFAHCAPPGQTSPHAPQLFGSFLGSTHPVPHRISGALQPAGRHTCWAGSQAPLQHLAPPPKHAAPAGLHCNTHIPFTHENPPPQAMPHPPQLFGSLVPSTHTPPHGIAGAAQETQVLVGPQIAPPSHAPPAQQVSPTWPQNEQAAPTHLPPNAAQAEAPAGVPQTRHSLFASHAAPPGQPPQSTWVPQPLSATPHWMPPGPGPQCFGVQAGGVQTSPLHTLGAGQFDALHAAAQAPAVQAPLQHWPANVHGPPRGWQTGARQVPPLQTLPGAQLPHWSVPPQPSGADPHWMPCCAQVSGLQPPVHVPAEQISPAGQSAFVTQPGRQQVAL